MQMNNDDPYDNERKILDRWFSTNLVKREHMEEMIKSLSFLKEKGVMAPELVIDSDNRAIGAVWNNGVWFVKFFMFDYGGIILKSADFIFIKFLSDDIGFKSMSFKGNIPEDAIEKLLEFGFGVENFRS